MRACVCVLIILPFYLPLRKQQKAARAGWSLRSGADSQPLPWAEGWGGGLFFFCVCGGVVVRRRGPPGCFSVFRVKLCQPQSPPGCGKEEPPPLPRRGWGPARLCPRSLSWLRSVLRLGPGAALGGTLGRAGG